MIDQRILAVQGIGYAPFAVAVQGVLALSTNVPRYYRKGGGPETFSEPVHDWRYGIQPKIRKTGDQLADLKTHLTELASAPFVGETELERQAGKLARTFVLVTPEGPVDVPLFKPMIAALPANLRAEMAAYTAKVRAEINEERRRILLLLSA